MKFTEQRLEQAIIDLLGKESIHHIHGETFQRSPEEVLIQSDLREFLSDQYAAEGITATEIAAVIRGNCQCSCRLDG